eukprot:NODE_1359_length_1539_cov_25.992918_g1286_i0.p1 GENE.NODE_1359_length_1539_cov_25.992918_g1286_i0~~NODE_1359_length_1539_cov_25.992918_g1286_i0.p1  ORF type:complete len:490 (-),score=84.89 NODE_1359_length_1539_cov_25.992918_g1286_i0:68-1324(-)
MTPFLKCLKGHLTLLKTDPNTFTVHPPNHTLSHSLAALDIPQSFSNCRQAEMGGLLDWGGKVTRKIRETSEVLFGHPTGSLLDVAALQDVDSVLVQGDSQQWCGALSGKSHDAKKHQASEPRGPPLTEEQWRSEYSGGRCEATQWQRLKTVVFHGGIDPPLRSVVWPHLLGIYAGGRTYTDLQNEYLQYLTQWRSITPAQESRFRKYRDRKGRVEKDVLRADRSHPYYTGDTNPHLSMLHNILLTYAFYNFDLGYCQGMGDLLAPLLSVIDDEVLGFWCFVHLMERYGGNFNRDQAAMNAQLRRIGQVLRVVDPQLWDHLMAVDGLNFFFCFRWVLVQFKREFDYEALASLWEVFWAGPHEYHIWACVYLLTHLRADLMARQADDLMQCVNDKAGSFDMRELLAGTQALYVAFQDLEI